MTTHHPPIILHRRHAGAYLTVHDTPTILLAGELHNSSASSLAYLEPILDRLQELHLNTVLAPLSWELVEPTEGEYDFALLDGIMRAARRRGLSLVFLWFGTLKNAVSSYAPAWVKTDTQRFFRAQTAPGVSTGAVSVFCAEAQRCDARAFAAVMARIREIDADEGTVLMVQVENEPGLLGAARDHHPTAEAAFQGAVPDALLAYLSAYQESLLAELPRPQRSAGTWSEVFGMDAEEIFMAWHVARFLEQVAAAGRAEYELPLFANAWLIAGPGYAPGQYPSGGPVSKLLDIWQAAAPTLDLLAPDIYLQDFRAECAAYARAGNPLFIPEARNDACAAANVLYAIGRHHALGFSPFAIDDLPADHPLGETYAQLREMMPLLSAAYGSERLTAFLQQADEEEWTAELGSYSFRARTRQPLADGQVPGAALLLALSDDEFLVLGRSLVLTFTPRDPDLPIAEIVHLDTGTLHNGDWRPGRRLNGDETYHGTAVLLGAELTAFRFKLHAF